MPNFTLPTSKDIYLEVNGRKVAVVESYRAQAVRESKNVEAFGETEPVATVGGKVRYLIELSRVYAAQGPLADGIDFYALTDFNLVIHKPDCRIVYSGCEWSDIGEAAGLNDTVLESVKILSSRRMVIQ